MRLVEKHVIKRHHPYFKEIDNLCFLAENLYNYANYLIRQSFIFEGKYLNYNIIQKLCQNSVDYKALPAKVSQQILMRLNEAWQGFFSSLASYKEHPEKFFTSPAVVLRGSPRIPSYLHKTSGRFPCIYTIQAISKKYLKKSQINPSKTNILVTTNVNQICQVRLVPKGSYYVFEVIYERQESSPINTSSNIAGIDIGLNNLAAVTSNTRGFKPILVNGKPLKKINAYYHKIRRKLQSLLPGKQKTSGQIQNLTCKRNFKIYDYLHKSSRLIINYLAANQIGTLVIGHNDKWKQSINLGQRNNQNFVSIPFDKFISMLKYKAQLIGIKVIITEESYTSKCSFIDSEPLSKQSSYKGKRVKRGLFRSQSGILINADCNGSGNIIRKVVPNAFLEGIQGVVVPPVRITPHK